MASMPKVAYHTLGCKLNFSETSEISRILSKEGFQKVAMDENPEIFILNTCSVTENANKECRQIVRKILRQAPSAKIVVVGCYAQLKPEEIASISGVDLVLGAKEKFRIGDYLKFLHKEKSATADGKIYSCDINEVRLFERSYSLGERTRSFLKVQDGCDYSCTYCTIPLARGKSRSDTIASVVDQAELLAGLGAKEIVLTGVNIGDFGIHDPGAGKRNETFFQLIQELDELNEDVRFRISSIEPNLLKDHVIDFVSASKRFTPHFHLPLQSGSDNILRRMKRRYLSGDYASRVEKIKRVMPHCCIGADVIVGFPGETDKDFSATCDFLLQLDISYLHVFTYSEREHTEASEMNDIVPIHIRHERNKILRNLSDEKKAKFYRQQLGKVNHVLFESETDNGYSEGFTENYITTRVHGDEALRGNICSVRLERLDSNKVIGILVKDENDLIHSAAIFAAN